MGGLTRSLGDKWGAFGGLGTINQSTVNQFRTDVQVKLEDPALGEKSFLQTSLPFEITLSIDPGETLEIYYARGAWQNRWQRVTFGWKSGRLLWPRISTQVRSLHFRPFPRSSP